MKKEGYSEVLLNDFLFNSGIVGLLRIFRYTEDETGGCKQGTDYIIDGQSIYIKDDFLLKQDMGDLFVRAMVYYLGSSTKYERVIDKQSVLNSLYAEPKPEDAQWRKSVDGIYKEFTDMLAKNSFKSGYVILSKNKNINVPSESIILALKKEADYLYKKQLYDQIIDQLNQDKVREILIFKDLLYSVINMFYADNKGNGAAFLSEREIEPSLAYNEKFLKPLRESISNMIPQKHLNCISCGAITDKKLAHPVTLFVDTADDLGKKKSYYWNCNPDAYMCPLCAFICSLAPLGFSYFSSDGVFINNNSDVETLRSFSNVLEESKDESTNGTWFYLCNTFTSEKINHVLAKTNNIQVIIRSKNNENYSLNIIDKSKIKVFNKCYKEFNILKSRYVKDKTDYINVYQQTVENVIAARNQFSLMTKLLRISLNGENQHINYILNILSIQITQKGGENVDSSIKRAYMVKKQGEVLRATITEGLSENDKDNKIRGLVYQMLNAVSLGNRDKFMELILRTYSGLNMPVPDVFFTSFESDEKFKEIGFAYLLGLKSANYKKEEADKQ